MPIADAPRGRPLASLTRALADETATERLAAEIAPQLDAGWVIALSGDLGAGKTRFTRALLSALGHAGRVRSPTFTLVEPYNLSKFDLYHFDFYRFTDENDWLDAGFGDAVGAPGIVSVIEWPERAGMRLPGPDLWIRLAFADDPAAAATVDAAAIAAATDTRRVAQLEAFTERGLACLNTLAAATG